MADFNVNIYICIHIYYTNIYAATESYQKLLATNNNITLLVKKNYEEKNKMRKKYFDSKE